MTSLRQNPLVAALRGEPPTMGHSPQDAQRLIAAAGQHGVLVALHRATAGGRGDIDDRLWSELAAGSTLRRAQALRISVAAAEVSDWFGAAGVRCAVLKGPAVATAYPHGDREYSDLDVLVSPSQMVDAIRVVRSHGARPHEHLGWPRADAVAELGFQLARGVALDLHAELISQADVRREFWFPPDALLDRAATANVLGTEIPVLDPEDTIVHVAVHAMVSGGERLVWLADLDALVRQDRLHWPTLIERARQARAALVVDVMLERAALVLGTPVPRDARRALRRRGAAWALLLRTFERARPTAANYGRSLRGQVLVRATRDTTLRSLATLTRLLWTDVVVPVTHDRHHPWRVRLRQRLSRLRPAR